MHAIDAHAPAQACQNDTWAVLRVYDAMVNVRGGDLHGRELHTPRLRLRVLSSALLLLQALEARLRSQAPAGSAWLTMRASLTEVGFGEGVGGIALKSAGRAVNHQHHTCCQLGQPD